MDTDWRDISNGWQIPSEGYCDQPYVVVNDDGTWTCVMTTGQGREGQHGQHVVSTISTDRGRSWSGLIDIEPASGPEASWVMPLRTPSGRIYAFYTYNKENRRSIRNVDGGDVKRVDSFGTYAYRYSDDGGRSWSVQRYEIPMRLFDIDRENVYGGEIPFFWGVGKPFLHDGAAYVCASKVGGFGAGFFVRNEGVLFRSPNLLTAEDPSEHVWETLPEGEAGMRSPAGPIAGEFNATPMNDGSLYGTYRTIEGYSCHAYSRDGGRTWTEPAYMTYTPGGRKVKNPRAANFVRRLSNGHYIYWFHFHGGPVLASMSGIEGIGYQHRNPVWMCGGVEKDGFIHWSQPEVILYDDNPGIRMSYPDFIDVEGEVYCTETQKDIARVHRLDEELLTGMWRQGLDKAVARQGLVLEATSCDTVDMPQLPLFSERDGISLDLRVRFDDLRPWQILFDSRDPEGRGLLVQTTDRKTVRLSVIGRTASSPGGTAFCGMAESSWECDPGLLESGRVHHLTFIADGGPKIISVLVDGQLCDGGQTKQYGWGRFNPYLRDANGAAQGRVAPSLNGELLSFRLYDRYLRTSEAVANWQAENGTA